MTTFGKKESLDLVCSYTKRKWAKVVTFIKFKTRKGSLLRILNYLWVFLGIEEERGYSSLSFVTN